MFLLPFVIKTYVVGHFVTTIVEKYMERKLFYFFLLQMLFTYLRFIKNEIAGCDYNEKELEGIYAELSEKAVIETDQGKNKIVFFYYFFFFFKYFLLTKNMFDIRQRARLRYSRKNKTKV